MDSSVFTKVRIGQKIWKQKLERALGICYTMVGVCLQDFCQINAFLLAFRSDSPPRLGQWLQSCPFLIHSINYLYISSFTIEIKTLTSTPTILEFLKFFCTGKTLVQSVWLSAGTASISKPDKSHIKSQLMKHGGVCLQSGPWNNV